MNKQYIALSPLHMGAPKGGKRTVIQPGEAVTLSDEEAKPLLECKAVRLPEVVAQAAE
jgi:hypothetical protein